MMFVDYIGKVFRSVPHFKGKHLIGRSIISRLVRGRGYQCVVEMSAPGGGRLLCHLDDWIPWNVFLYGNYEVESNYEKVMLELLPNDGVVVDVGANIGYYTVQFSRLTRNRVYSFEPMAPQFSTLVENLKLNGLSNVTARKEIVSNHEGIGRIYYAGPTNTGMSSMERPSEEHEDVPAITLDGFALREGIDCIDLLKIDVEGHELKVLEGAQNLLSSGKIKHLFVEINEVTLGAGSTSTTEVCSHLMNHGYRPKSIKAGGLHEYTPGSSESLVYFHRN